VVEKFFGDMLEHDNVLSVLHMADHYQAYNLKLFCTSHILKHREAVMSYSGTRNIHHNTHTHTHEGSVDSRREVNCRRVAQLPQGASRVVQPAEPSPERLRAPTPHTTRHARAHAVKPKLLIT
jgi:hypothetical protein